MKPQLSSKAVFVIAAFALLALYPLVGGKFGVDLVTKVMIFAIFALSLELLVGGTGLVCFGQAAFFGIGAYAAVLLSPQDGQASLAWLLPAAVLAAALYALAVGALSLRTKGVYFIMVTLAFAQMAYYVVHDTPLGGGTDGIYLTSKPVLGTLVDLDRPLVLYASWPCCRARALAARWPASASMNNACAPPVLPPTPTSWRRSRSLAASPAWRASCSP
jgi:branched-chain amino acid transport system permease protein